MSQWINEYREPVESALDAATARVPGVPQKLSDAIRHAVLAPGKRLRPMLTLLSHLTLLPLHAL
jgi:geranylgeranyl diphosphate synthase type II